jgi:four helix bundle protein
MDKPHKKLDLWNLAMDLVVEVYRVVQKFPAHETYGLVQQVKRSVVSVPSNIAEGAARQTRKEFINFLHVAQGSLSELDTQLELAQRLGYLKDNESESLNVQMERIDKMLTGLMRQQKSLHPSRLTPHASRGKR